MGDDWQAQIEMKTHPNKKRVMRKISRDMRAYFLTRIGTRRKKRTVDKHRLTIPKCEQVHFFGK
jgi:hypothetical protein